MKSKHFNETERKNLYFDKNREEIQAGMTLRGPSGELETVYECGDELGNINLGFMATNPQFLKYHPDWPVEYYPLYQFELDEWEIVKEV